MLYLKLQCDQIADEVACGRLLVLLAMSALLAVTPTEHAWRVGVVGCVVVGAMFIRKSMDLIARHWFMHALTLRDVFDDAPGSFGGADDADAHGD